MNQYLDFSKKIMNIIPPELVLIDEPMKKHTNFKVGGPADIMVIPENRAQLELVLKLAKENQVPFFIMGNGSNIIVRDGGIRGLVIKLERLNRIQVEGDSITAEAGAQIIEVSKVAKANSLSGLEFACGIPGSVGGAVFMNAGAYNGEMSSVVESVLVITPDGELLPLKNGELEMAYRTSRVKTHGYIVLEARLKLEKGDQETISSKMADLTHRREERQPLEFPSAGSTFKRPEGFYAGKLIEDAGLRGYRIGGAAVSEKHCGFVINKGNASAAEILQLIDFIQTEVSRNYGVQLETEVLIVGENTLTVPKIR